MGERITPSLVLSVIAIVIACTASATAATLITGSQIKNGTITAEHVKKRSLTGKKIAQGSLGRRTIANDAITSAKVKDGSLALADLATGGVNLTLVSRLGTGSSVVECPAGMLPVSGSVSTDAAGRIIQSAPLPPTSPEANWGWQGSAVADGGGAAPLVATQVLCSAEVQSIQQ
jgi:hypothetical protein